MAVDALGSHAKRRYRLAAVTTHPIQYQAPLWRRIAASPDFDLKVFFASAHGLESSRDSGFGISFAWDIPLLEGYDGEILGLKGSALGGRGPGSAIPFGLARRLRRGRWDAVLVHGYTTAAAAAAVAAGRRAGIPLILRGESHLRDPRRPGVEALKGALLPSLLRFFDGFLAIGTWNRDYWLKYGVSPDSVETAYYSVDNDAFRAALAADQGRRDALRRSWRAGSESTVFLFAGKLIPVKGVEILLRAYARVERDADARLVLVGTGPLEGRLRSLATQLGLRHLYWEGFVNQKEIPYQFEAADVLALPSLAEPWGLVVNEAMACGTPCLVSDVVGASPDLVAGRGTGIVFRSGDVEDLARAMRASLDRTVRQRWQAAIPEVLRDFTFDQNVGALRRLVSRISHGGERWSAAQTHLPASKAVGVREANRFESIKGSGLWRETGPLQREFRHDAPLVGPGVNEVSEATA